MEQEEERKGGDILSMDVEMIRDVDLNIPEFVFIVLSGEKGYSISEAQEMCGSADIQDLEYRGWIKHTVKTEEVHGEEKKRDVIVPRKPFKELRDGVFSNSGKSPLQVQREKKFEEFFTEFPLKVPDRTGYGSRALRSRDSGTKNHEDARKRYIRKLSTAGTRGYDSDDHMHRHIMKVLKAEKKLRRDTNSFQYMHNIITWLNQEDFDVYSYLLDEYTEEQIEGSSNLPGKNEEEGNHGHTLI